MLVFGRTYFDLGDIFGPKHQILRQGQYLLGSKYKRKVPGYAQC